MISIRIAVVLGACVFASQLTGCATITGSEHQNISVQTREQSGRELAGAACEFTNSRGRWTVTSPGSVTINRSNEDMQVVCSKSGVEPGRAVVTSATKGSMFGNIVFGGGVGAIIDHSKGTAYEYPSFIQVVMGMVTNIAAPDLNSNPPATDPSAKPVPSNALSASALDASMEDRLKELKRLHETGLITRDIYLERQRLLLDTKR